MPTALTSLPGTGEALNSVNRFGGYRLAALPGQSATFTTAPLSAPLTLVGSGRINLAVTSSGRRGDPVRLACGTSVRTEPATQASLPQTAVLPQLAVAPVHLTDLTPREPTDRAGRPARRGPPGAGRPPAARA